MWFGRRKKKKQATETEPNLPPKANGLGHAEPESDALQDESLKQNQPSLEQSHLNPSITSHPSERDIVSEVEASNPADQDIETVASDNSVSEVRPELTEAPAEKTGFFARLTKGLGKSSSKLGTQISDVFTKSRLDQEKLDELEDILIMSDMGAEAAAKIRKQISKDRFDKDVDEAEIKSALAEAITVQLKEVEQEVDLSSGSRPQILLFVGVNGAGKTTTIGKIAHKFSLQGARTLIVAGDTFRAAAVEQLQVWSDRAGADILTTTEGGDSAALAYEAVQKAQREDYDCVIIDTAGRLQNKTELMGELAKIIRVIRKLDPDGPHHVLLVLDATVGQNALSQVEAFRHSAGVTGLVVTKLDGTAKGGVLLAVAEKHGLPVHFIGVGESSEDLDIFNAHDFAKALIGS